ncbi:hypothetical protein DBV05_g8340 [Lasiodiplodia theobromae]|uniref:Uncharacterized protein n=1 Tax=Lasiodiplodia theobromae TaxID=45133 RepID=A0A5N5D6K7_9PEZI|nr:hypothetical protein DBV05_g8340 [Lasiodiplodia theobromae]
MSSTPNGRSARKPPASVSASPPNPSNEGPPGSDRPTQGGKSIESLAKLKHNTKLLQRLPSPDIVHWVAFPPIEKGTTQRHGFRMAYQLEPDGSRTRIYAVLIQGNPADEVGYLKVDLTSGGVVTIGEVDNLHSLQLPWPFSKKQDPSKSGLLHDQALRELCTRIIKQLAVNCNVAGVLHYSEKSKRAHEDEIRKIVDDISDNEAEEGVKKWREFFRESREEDNLREGSGTRARHELKSSQESNAEDKAPSIWDSYRMPTAYQSMELADIGKEMRRVMILTSFIEWEWKIEESAKIRWPLQPSEQRDQLCDRFIDYATKNPETSLDMIGFRWLEETRTHLHSIGITMDIEAILKEKLHANQEKEDVDLESLPVVDKDLLYSWIVDFHPHYVPNASYEQQVERFMDQLKLKSADGPNDEAELEQIRARLIDKFKNSGDLRAFERAVGELVSAARKFEDKQIVREFMKQVSRPEGKKPS